MRIVVLHGPGEVGKRAEVLKIRSYFNKDLAITLDLKQDDLGKLESAILFKPLFSEGRRLIIVENCSDKLDLEKLPKLEDDLVLVVVAASLKNDSILLKSAAKIRAKVSVFEGEKELTAFPFLDSLLERKKQSFVELEKLFSEYGWMYTITMIYYGLRRNFLPLPTSSFAQKKIIAQKRNFKSEEFEQLYRLTLETEFNIKSGNAADYTSLARLVQSFIGG